MSVPSWAEPLFGPPLKIVAILMIGVFARYLLHRLIDRVAEGIASGTAGLARLEDRASASTARLVAAPLLTERREQRARTTASVLKSVATAVITAVVLLTVLDVLSIPVAPLLAGASIVGVAAGFGAQSLVKDVISGLFMMVEDQYGVGDVVDLGDAVGTVEDVSLRVTSLRDASGVLWFIRNGEVVRVANRSQGWAVANADFPVAYDADLESALSALRVMVTQIHEQPPWGEKLVEVPQVVGVESITGTSMVLRVTARCVAGTQIDVQRELRLRGKEALDRAGIPGPALPSGMFGPGSQRPGESAGAGI